MPLESFAEFGIIQPMAGHCDRSTALWVLQKLRHAGYIAYFAGGCVRDMLLGRPSYDYDVATSAEPADVQNIFHKVLMVGAQFGVAMVVQSGQTVEVATFRNDFNYTDGRRPDGVAFSTPEEDAKRRDFTINGMFYDPLNDEIIDFVEGQDDLESGIIRTIGNPASRFNEDYLRMLRAVRFAVRFDFNIENATKSAIRELSPNITKISGERICDEVSRMLTGNLPQVAMKYLAELGLAQHVLPELFTDETRWHGAMARLAAGRTKSAIGQLGLLLCDLDTDEIHGIIRRWGGSNDWKKSLEFFSKNRDAWQDLAAMRLCDLKKLLVHDCSDELRQLWKFRECVTTRKCEKYAENESRISAIDPDNVSPSPLVTGSDLMEMGVDPGRKMGEILDEIYDLQLDEKIKSRSDAMDYAKELVKAGS